MIGSKPVALTTFQLKGCGSEHNDLANNSLKKLPNLKYSYLKCTYLVLRAYLKVRSIIPKKTIKVSSKSNFFFKKNNMCLMIKL